MARKSVEVVPDVATAKLFVDPVKRQILRHLAEKEMTQKMLGEALGMADPSVYYHLKELKAAGLVGITRSEPEVHGILQKFYQANALYFIADYGRMPLEVRRYFLAVNLERLRGIFAVLRALHGMKVALWSPLSSREMEKIADRVAYFLAEVAKEHEAQAIEGDREALIVNLYEEALTRAIEKDPAGMEPLTSQLSVLGLAGKR